MAHLFSATFPLCTCFFGFSGMSRRVRDSEVYRTKRWRSLRRRKLDSVMYQCESCGIVDTRLECHHNTPMSEGGPEFPDLDGLTALCKSCHAAVHAERSHLAPHTLAWRRHLRWKFGRRA